MDCILGDSILSKLDERRLGRNNEVKVRFHRGGNLKDLHVGTNNAPNHDPMTIVNCLIRLKRYIEAHLETCSEVYLHLS